MTRVEEPYRIVVGVDFSELSSNALEHAFATCALRTRAEVHMVVSVVDGRSELVPAMDHKASLTEITDHVREKLATYGTNALATYRASYPACTPFALVAHVRLGPVAEQLAALSNEILADLVIVGTHGRSGLPRVLLGSVAERIVRLAPCPVLVVRPVNKHGLDGVPRPNPACPACVAKRQKTDNAEWWCDAHAVAPEPAHAFSHSRRLDQPPQPYLR